MAKLRQSDLVSIVSIIQDTGSDLVSNNEPIFSDSATLRSPADQNTITMNEATRYWYGRINAVRAQDNIKAQNITPSNVAVIDSGGFLDGHEDRPDYVRNNGSDHYVTCDNNRCSDLTIPSYIL